MYTFKIYSGYKFFQIIQICTNLKYAFIFWQDELIYATGAFAGPQHRTEIPPSHSSQVTLAE